VFAPAAKKEIVDGRRSPALRHDYGQTAWVGIASFVADTTSPPGPGVAYERFTRHGPAALLPLKDGRAGLVWCVDSADDPVRNLDDAQRVAVLNTIFHPRTPRLAAVSPLKNFPLGLLAERTLTDGRTVRIGNAARPCTRSPARGSTSACATPSSWCARSPASATSTRCCAASNGSAHRPLGDDRGHRFPRPQLHLDPARAAAARGLGIAALQALGPVKSAIARQMMFGSR
jgi:2-octaprenyl-6-methoxyphenol hydroxylase